jgi:hypothetical protein
MAKRIISDTTWKSKKVRSVQPPEFRPEYAWLMPNFEDNGVCEMDAEAIWSEAYGAARPGWTPEKVQQLLEELIRVGLYQKYEVEGKTYLYLVGSDKPGHLPPPSQRYSTLPLPAAYGDPRVAQRIAHTGIGIGSGTGSGSGNGTGRTGTGTEQEQSASRSSSVSQTDKKTDKTRLTPKSKAFQIDESEDPKVPAHLAPQATVSPAAPTVKSRFEIGVGSTALTLVALTEHIHCVTGIPEIRANDPCLPFLVSLAEERLALQQTWPKSIPPEGWTEPEGRWDENTTANFVEVLPGDPRYPGPDDTYVTGGLTGRDGEASWAWIAFSTGLEYLRALGQYLPGLKSEEELPPGMIEYSEEDLLEVLRGLTSWPNDPIWHDEPGWISTKDVPMCKFWAVAHWAFKKSNYWPDRLKTLQDFLKAFPKLVEQYDKFYARLPEGKKPHDLHVGRPETHLEGEVAMEPGDEVEMPKSTAFQIEED